MYKNNVLHDIIEWDIRNWSKAVSYWDNNLNQDFQNCIALELGARHGGLSLWFALKGGRVVCSDIQGPTEMAKQKHKKYNIHPLIEYERIDATNILYSNYFDFVLFKSILGGIGRNDKKESQEKTIEEIYKSLKTGGMLLFAENLMGSPIHRFFRKKFVKWGREWRYINVSEIEELLNPFSDFKYLTFGFVGAFGRNETQRNILGFFDEFFFEKIVPDHWKYIIFGIAKK